MPCLLSTRLLLPPSLKRRYYIGIRFLHLPIIYIFPFSSLWIKFILSSYRCLWNGKKIFSVDCKSIIHFRSRSENVRAMPNAIINQRSIFSQHIYWGKIGKWNIFHLMKLYTCERVSVQFFQSEYHTRLSKHIGAHQIILNVRNRRRGYIIRNICTNKP